MIQLSGCSNDSQATLSCCLENNVRTSSVLLFSHFLAFGFIRISVSVIGQDGNLRVGILGACFVTILKLLDGCFFFASNKPNDIGLGRFCRSITRQVGAFMGTEG